jgi:NAD(P)-dependent dehydrogenase (short-subunit alcohol dehydrogenase family)
MTTVGFIGSGAIGSTIARLAVEAGHQVVLSNSRGPETLAETAAELSGRLCVRGQCPNMPMRGSRRSVSERPRHHQRKLVFPEGVAVRAGPLGHDNVRAGLA